MVTPFKRQFTYFYLRYDPPVPEGTSVVGFKGIDTRYGKNPEYKCDNIGKLEDFQEEVISVYISIIYHHF